MSFSPLKSSVKSSLFQSIPFLNGLFVLLMSSFWSSLYNLENSPLSNVGLMKIFSHSVGCRFVLLVVSFALQKFLCFRRSHLLIVVLTVCATVAIYRE